MKIRSLLNILLILVGGMFFFSCENPVGKDPGSTTDDTPPVDGDFTSTPDIGINTTTYLDILNSQIVNTTVNMEFSLDGGVSWTECSGSSESVSLSLGNHVMVRDISDNSWLRDLGEVGALSGRPDLMTTNQLYIGFGSWNDSFIVNPGDQFNIFSYMNNLGDTDAGPQNIHFYLSGDNVIDPSEDYLLYDYIYNYSSRASSEIYVSDSSDFSLTVPDVPAGTYYIGVVMDATDAVSELNENNNISLPEDTAVLIVSDDEVLPEGAVKIVNSWGVGGWENVDDGSYWMPYSVLKANKLGVFFYKNDFSAEYDPSIIASFRITHAHRDEIKVTFGLGDPSDPLMTKVFESRGWDGTPMGGDIAFPANKMILDITEFAPAINDYNLFVSIENTGSTTGTLDNLSVEFYNSYSNDPAAAFKTQSSSDTGSIPAGSGLNATVNTIGMLTRTELQAIIPLLRSTTSSSFSVAQPASSELARDKIALGVSKPGVDYNKLYKGHGTGYRPPSEEEWNSMVKLESVETGIYNLRASFDGTTLPLSVDNSATDYFPPVGNQGQKGSCAAFSVGYYIQTYTEAKEHGWDLSATTWGSDITGVSDAGSPQSNLNKIFSPDFLYNQINNGVDEGAWPGSAISTIIRQGGATWSTMPYRNQELSSDFTYWPSEAAWREAPRYRGEELGNYYWPDDNYCYFIIEDDSDIQMLKALLNMGYIVSTAIFTDTTYDNLDTNDVVGSGTVWYPTSPDHAQTIVGYKEGAAWDPSTPES
ncbi:MAG: hypothetical protein JXR86_17490 [Spirochaetales bacterium]|nr:hypothetical protein [Spirochaetales bacterium]